MTFNEAFNLLKSLPDVANYILIKINYSRLILPFADGIQLLQALRQAETIDTWPSDRMAIAPINPEQIEISLMSQTEYRKIKLSMLLDVSLKDLPDVTTLSLTP